MGELAPAVNDILSNTQIKLGEIALGLDQQRQALEGQPEATVFNGNNKQRAMELGAELLAVAQRGFRFATEALSEPEPMHPTPEQIEQLRAVVNGEQISISINELTKAFAGRTLPHATVNAIQAGHIRIEEKLAKVNMSPWQLELVHLLARGWRAAEIADRNSVSTTSIMNNYDAIHRHLQAKSLPHAILRAFEIGIFKVDEAIPNPEEFTPQLLIDDRLWRMRGLEIYNPYEIEFIKSLMHLKRGFFGRGEIYKADFLAHSSHHAKEKAFVRVVKSLPRKFSKSVGESIIEASGERTWRMYKFRKSITIYWQGQENTIPVCDEAKFEAEMRRRHKESTNRIRVVAANNPNLEARTSRKKNSSQRKRESIVDLPPRRNPLEDYLDANTLPKLDEEFLHSLTPRDLKQLPQNEDERIKTAHHLSNQHPPYDWRSIVIGALTSGIYNEDSRAPVYIKRHGEYAALREIVEKVPRFIGLSLKDISRITGLKPAAIVEVRQRLMQNYQGANGRVRTDRFTTRK